LDLKNIQKSATIKLIRALFGEIKPSANFNNRPKSIALMAQERFGDVIMMSPLIRMLKKNYPNSELYIICVNSIAEYLKYDPNIKMVLKAKHPSGDVKRFLKSTEFDILFNTKDHPSVTFLYLTRRIKAKHRVGISHPEHRGFFDFTIQIPEKPQKTVSTYFTLLEYLGIPYSEEDQRPYLPLGPVSDDIQSYAKKLEQSKYIAINLSASQTYKEWPIEKWMEFLQKIKQPTCIIAMPKHQQEKQVLEENFDHIIPSPPTRSIFDAGYLINHSKILISPDTALVHIASCFNTPTLALYRQPLDLQNFPPLSKNHKSVMAPNLDISDISTSEVIESFSLLEKTI
jgi:ADP-heptose:LPS heptosyltransferase